MADDENAGIIHVRIPKAGKDANGNPVTIPVDVNTIPLGEGWNEVVRLGLEAVANARMSKVGAVTKMTGADLEKANAAALQIANENLEALKTGNLKPKGKGKGVASNIPGDTPAARRELQTEARRIGRELVKNEIRKAGLKPSHVAASEITKAADAMIAQDPSIIAQAQANIASRGNLTSEIDLGKFVDIGKAKAKGEEAKAKTAATKAAAPLSKTQAGIVAKRKPQAAVGAVH